MSLLTETYRVPISAILMDEYWETLEAYPIERVDKAVRECIRSPDCLFRPTPGELIGVLRDQRVETPLLSEPLPTEEDNLWSKYNPRFCSWLMGYKKVGTKRVGRGYGQYKTESIFSKGEGRWKEIRDDPERWKALFVEFLKTQKDVPAWFFDKVCAEAEMQP